MSKKSAPYLRISYIIIIAYISFLNFFIIKATPEIIALQFGILVGIYGFFNKRIKVRKFLRSWIPFIALFSVYEFLRGIADDLSPFYNSLLYKAYEAEIAIFGELPTKFLQDRLLSNQLVINISLLFYSAFFYFSFLVGFIIWNKNSSLFDKYKNKFIILSYVGLIFYFLIPTAPPWYVHKLQNLGIERYVYGDTILKNFTTLSIYRYFVYGNAVAAFPSLHTAWPAFTSLFLVKYFKNNWLYLTFIVPLIIAFSVVLTAEHYVIDIIFGWILAGLIVYFPRSKDKT